MKRWGCGTVHKEWGLNLGSGAYRAVEGSET